MAAKKSTPSTTETQAETPRPKSAKAVLKFLRISPRKARLVIDTVRYAPVQKAFHVLMTLKQKAARITEKLLKSAVANAKNLGLDETRLYVSDIRADGGPSMKRYMQRSMGRAEVILKRMTHLSVIVSESDRQIHGAKAAEEGEKQEGSSKPSSKKNAVSKKKVAAGAAKA